MFAGFRGLGSFSLDIAECTDTSRSSASMDRRRAMAHTRLAVAVGSSSLSSAEFQDWSTEASLACSFVNAHRVSESSDALSPSKLMGVVETALLVSSQAYASRAKAHLTSEARTQG